MQKGIIDQALAYMKEKFEHEYSGHDYFHTLRVFNMATRIAKSEQADVELVQLAALLHDVDDRKLSPATNEQQTNARSFLRAHGVDEATIEAICKMIREVSFVGNESVTPVTLEGKCVQDADRLDAIGAIGIARAFAYGGNHQRLMYHPDVKPNLNMSREEYIKSQSTTINHFYEKLFKLTAMMNTKTAIEIARAREAYMKEYVDEILSEWNGNK